MADKSMAQLDLMLRPLASFYLLLDAKGPCGLLHGSSTHITRDVCFLFWDQGVTAFQHCALDQGYILLGRTTFTNISSPTALQQTIQHKLQLFLQ